jgi:hypothetical protein
MTQLISTAVGDDLAVAVCPNCGATITGRYCGDCGQKRIHEADLTVRHFLGHVLHELTHLESNKTFDTFVALICRPGLLTREYVAGRRGKYVEPVQLYLMISAVFFLFAWGAHLERGGFNERVTTAFAPIADRKGLDAPRIIEDLKHKLEKYVAVARFASVLPAGLVLALLFRRPTQYYVHHLVFALHYISFGNLLSVAYSLAFAVVGRFHAVPHWVDLTSSLVLVVYAFVAMRTVYRQPRPATALKAAAFVAADVGLAVVFTTLAAAVSAVVVLAPFIAKP